MSHVVASAKNFAKWRGLGLHNDLDFFCQMEVRSGAEEMDRSSAAFWAKVGQGKHAIRIRRGERAVSAEICSVMKVAEDSRNLQLGIALTALRPFWECTEIN